MVGQRLTALSQGAPTSGGVETYRRVEIWSHFRSVKAEGESRRYPTGRKAPGLRHRASQRAIWAGSDKPHGTLLRAGRLTPLGYAWSGGGVSRGQGGYRQRNSDMVELAVKVCSKGLGKRAAKSDSKSQLLAAITSSAPRLNPCPWTSANHPASQTDWLFWTARVHPPVKHRRIVQPACISRARDRGKRCTATPSCSHRADCFDGCGLCGEPSVL